MTARSHRARTPEDLTDAEARRLRKLGFSAALSVLARYSGPAAERPRCTRLEYLECYISDAGATDLLAGRYALAQAARFLSDERSFLEYVPPEDIEDQEWLRFMVHECGRSDSDIAFQIDRARGGTGAPDVERVRAARQMLGLNPNTHDEDEDTIGMLVTAGPDGLSARDFLKQRDWIEKRVVERDMSDGAIAKELARVGCPCDRSTVRLYRRKHDLARPGTGTDG